MMIMGIIISKKTKYNNIKRQVNYNKNDDDANYDNHDNRENKIITIMLILQQVRPFISKYG